MNRRLTIFITFLVLLFTGCSTRDIHPEEAAGLPFSETLSSPGVTAFARDARGFMWIGTHHGINIYDGSHYRQMLHSPEDSSSLRSNSVSAIYKDHENRMWVITTEGIDLYKGNGIFRHTGNPSPDAMASSILQTSEGKIIALFGGDLCELRNGTFRKKTTLPRNNSIAETAIYENARRQYLVNTGSHLVLCNKDLQPVRTLVKSSSIHTASDRERICCVTFNEGITYLKRSDFRTMFKTGKGLPIVPEFVTLFKGKLIITGNDGIYTHEGLSKNIRPVDTAIQNPLHYKFISRIYVDRKNILWIGYLHSGFIKLSGLQEITRKNTAEKIRQKIGNSDVLTLTHDSRGNIFGATTDDRLFYESGGQVRLFELSDLIPIHSRQHIQFLGFSAGLFWIVTDSHAFACHYQNGLQLDQFYDSGLATGDLNGKAAVTDKGLVVVLNRNSLLYLDGTKRQDMKSLDARTVAGTVIQQKGTLTVRRIKIKGYTFPFSSTVIPAEKDRIFILAPGSRILSVDLASGRARPLSRSLPGRILSTVHEGSHIFLGTDQGLYIWDQLLDHISRITDIPRQPVCNLVFSEGKLFFTSGGRICTYSPAAHRSSTLWHSGSTKDFLSGTLCVLHKNRVIVCNDKGLQQLTLNSGRTGSARPHLYIEGVKVFGNGKRNAICEIPQQDSLARVVLSHDENNISILFAAIDDRLSGEYTYQYRLKGYDGQWRQGNGENMAGYTRLAPGTYKFEVVCIRQDRPRIKVYRSQTILVKPHPLLSTTALLFYLLILAGGLVYANRLFIRIRMERVNSQNAEKDKQREQMLNKMNMNFFANISHEFRNPVTMINGPVSVLRNSPELSKKSQNMVKLISQSTSILLRLEDDAMRLSVSRKDVAAIIVSLAKNYEVSAAEKKIHFIYNGLEQPVFTLVDEDKISKIFDNLMTNALKHTPEKGTVTITMEIQDRQLHLNVENTGEQIPEKELSNIFKRYYEVSTYLSNWGTGIGLYYVHRLASLHHGSIDAGNTQKGICFYLTLPMDEKAYTETEKQLKETETRVNPGDDLIIRARREEDSIPKDKNSKPRMLIVEDDTNTSYFLRKIFEDDYTVFNRYDTESAMESLETIQADVIITDVRFTGTSGLDFCRELKKSAEYADIPVIMLTALNTDRQRTEGIDAGAEAYITKPFDTEYLRAIVRSAVRHLREHRELIRQIPQGEDDRKMKKTSEKNQEFMKSVYDFMEKNIMNGDLDVALLCRHLLVSRTKLYSRIKEITGKTPNEIFRHYKLNKAAKLLKEGNLNVSEISEKSGFSSIAYFSRTFKKHFGVSPKDFS